MDQSNVRYIPLSKLHNHPKNVRKTYTDLEELADSISGMGGVLQPLTVVEIPEKPGEFYVVIGNRRLRASKMAGIKELLCVVSDMDEAQVIRTMVQENMLRKDLTIVEEAESFQLMLDLGDSPEEIAKKTGFSRSTVKHRLQLAKLDRKQLEKREREWGHQLSLNDLYALEQVKDINVRNLILQSAYTSSDIRRRAEEAVREEKRQKTAKKILLYIPDRVKEAPQAIRDKYWTLNKVTLKSFNLDKGVPDEVILQLPKDPKAEIYWDIRYGSMEIYKVLLEEEKDKPKAQRETVLERHKKEITAKINKMKQDRVFFINNLIKNRVKSNEDTVSQILEFAFGRKSKSFFIGAGTVAMALTGETEWSSGKNEYFKALEKVQDMPMEYRLLACMNEDVSHLSNVITYTGEFNAESGESLQEVYRILEGYGWSFDDDEEYQIIHGTHPYYVKGKEDEEKTDQAAEEDVQEVPAVEAGQNHQEGGEDRSGDVDPDGQDIPADSESGEFIKEDPKKKVAGKADLLQRLIKRESWTSAKYVCRQIKDLVMEINGHTVDIYANNKYPRLDDDELLIEIDKAMKQLKRSIDLEAWIVAESTSGKLNFYITDREGGL